MSDWAVDPRLPLGIPATAKGTVVTVGTFDGIHRGHWAVLQEICRRARESGRKSVLVTFHPHPLRIVRPEAAPAMLTTPVEKKEILAETDLDYAAFVPFTTALSRYSPERFVSEILRGRLHMRELVIGYDFRFGRGRSGDVETLRRVGRELDFDVDVVGPVLAAGEPVSSTRIRASIRAGDLMQARKGLGRPYSVRGLVERGDGRGQSLGFPTANLRVLGNDKLIPPEGIYAVRGVLRTGTVPGALHLGPRPTFEGSPPTIEVHLMDFEGDLYGEEVRVDFVARLRGVRPFASVGELVNQMRQDVVRARHVLEGEGC